MTQRMLDGLGHPRKGQFILEALYSHFIGGVQDVVVASLVTGVEAGCKLRKVSRSGFSNVSCG